MFNVIQRFNETGSVSETLASGRKRYVRKERLVDAIRKKYKTPRKKHVYDG